MLPSVTGVPERPRVAGTAAQFSAEEQKGGKSKGRRITLVYPGNYRALIGTSSLTMTNQDPPSFK